MKIIIAYSISKNINLFILFVIFFLIELLKAGDGKIVDSKKYYKYMIYEPFIHTFIWVGLYLMNKNFPEFNITFKEFINQLQNISNNFLS